MEEQRNPEQQANESNQPSVDMAIVIRNLNRLIKNDTPEHVLLKHISLRNELCYIFLRASRHRHALCEYVTLMGLTSRSKSMCPFSLLLPIEYLIAEERYVEAVEFCRTLVHFLIEWLHKDTPVLKCATDKLAWLMTKHDDPDSRKLLSYRFPFQYR